jgi:prepilin-type processing-associated H-X9-DG protein
MWEHEFDPATRPFNQMIYGVEGVAAPSLDGNAGDTTRFQEFRCPGEDFGYQEWPGWPPPGGLPDEVERPYFWTNGTSYRMNNLTYQESAELFWIGGVYSRAVSQIPDSSITIGFMEARAFQTIHTNDAWGELEVHGELSGYHKKLGYFNVSYADGHAAYADMGNGTFYQRKLSNLFYDVRGTWGRMDCLPDKMILDD